MRFKRRGNRAIDSREYARVRRTIDHPIDGRKLVDIATKPKIAVGEVNAATLQKRAIHLAAGPRQVVDAEEVTFRRDSRQPGQDS